MSSASANGDGQRLRELDQDNLRLCAKTERRTPRARAPRRINQQISEPIESVDIPTVDTRRDPRERKHLSAVRVAGKLQRDAFLFGEGKPVRRMCEQDA